MSAHQYSPGGRVARWAWGLAIGLALFSGLGQMPMTKRYYIADLPGMGWSENFYTLGDLHYLSVALVLALIFWRLGLDLRQGGWRFSWGPRSWWGWTLLTVLALTGAGKALRNLGVFISPSNMLLLDLTHLTTAMIFMFTGLFSLFRRQETAGRPGNLGRASAGGGE
jgi:hypothetical protein